MANLLKTPALALAAAGLVLVAPAAATPPMHAPSADQAVFGELTWDHGKKDKRWKRDRDYYYGDRYDYHDDRDDRYDRDDRDYDDDRDHRPYYTGYSRNYGQPVYAHTRIWRGRDGRYYCRRDNGTTGLLVGAGVGALIGHEVAGRGDRTLGAILGGVAGGLLGRSIDRSNTRCG